MVLVNSYIVAYLVYYNAYELTTIVAYVVYYGPCELTTIVAFLVNYDPCELIHCSIRGLLLSL